MTVDQSSDAGATATTGKPALEFADLSMVFADGTHALELALAAMSGIDWKNR